MGQLLLAHQFACQRLPGHDCSNVAWSSVSCGGERADVRDDSPEVVLTQHGAIGRHRRSAPSDPFVEVVDRNVTASQCRRPSDTAVLAVAVVCAVLAEDPRSGFDDTAIFKIDWGDMRNRSLSQQHGPRANNRSSDDDGNAPSHSTLRKAWASGKHAGAVLSQWTPKPPRAPKLHCHC